MKLVKCISERESMPEQIIVGNSYWMDETTKKKDLDGDEYAQIYKDKLKQNKVGCMLCKHFVSL